jgi:uncharacterized protein involved in exopolysaccharide biosynthesis
LKYLGFAGISNGLLWGLSLAYLKNTPPSYSSELILNVAGNGQGVNVNLPDIGQAATSTTSAFGSSSDPRENYKLIGSGTTVVKAAAKSLKMTQKKFGEPRIKIINNTTILKIEITGKNPVEAQKKGKAIYKALTDRLNVLRSLEQAERDRAIKNAVNEAQSKLTEAQKKLSAYKAKSGLSSSKQLTDLIGNIEQLRKQRSEAIAQEQQVADRLQELFKSLQISPQDAANALLLQTDRQFQKNLNDYTDATAILSALLENRGPNYPDVLAAKQQQEAALKILLVRGESLLGKPLALEMLQRLSLDNLNGGGVKRSELFQQLITLHSERQGLIGQLNALTEQIEQLGKRLNVLVEKESILDTRLRELQIAEAVFTSTLAKVDLSKSDPFGSFPLLQLVEEPSLPEEPTSPKTKLVFIGTILGSFLITLGLTLIWWRTPILIATKKATRELLA